MLKKCIRGSIIILLAVLALTGCGEKEVEGVTGKEISSDGHMKAVIVRDFDESLYSKDELLNMMNTEADRYNTATTPDAVKVVSVECEEGVLTAVMEYLSATDYSAFNDRRYVMESLDDARANGDIRVSLRDVADMSDVNPDTIEETDKLELIITDEVGYITCPGKVRYISDGVEPVTSKQINVTEDMDGLAYIIYQHK